MCFRVITFQVWSVSVREMAPIALRANCNEVELSQSWRLEGRKGVLGLITSLIQGVGNRQYKCRKMVELIAFQDVHPDAGLESHSREIMHSIRHRTVAAEGAYNGFGAGEKALAI